MKKSALNALVFSAMLAAVSANAQADSVTYTLDPHHTFPVFQVNHLGLSTQRGRFDETQGTVTLDMAAKTGSVNLSINTKSLDMGFPEWNAHLTGPAFFNVDKFPTITFVSHKLDFEGDKVVGADGDFTLLGVTHPLHVTVHDFHCTEHPMAHKPVCAGDVTAEFKRSDYGMMSYIPMVGDEINIMVPVEALKN